jgi:hypothetical protein
MCRKLIYLISFVVLLCTASSVQAITTVTTAYGNGADTYLSNDSQNGSGSNNGAPDANHGTEGGITCRRYDGTRMKLPYIRFDINDVIGDLNDATLSLNFTSSKTTSTWNIYGLVNESKDNWPEATPPRTTYNNAPGFDPCALGYYRIDANLQSVGTISTPSGPGYITSSPASLLLRNFIVTHDTNQRLTFALIPATSISDDKQWYITSKEGNPALAPYLTFPYALGTKASYPYPADGNMINSTTVTLKWLPGAYADKHDVYLGTDFAAVNSATDPNTLPGRGRQDPNYYNATGLIAGKTYYWQIDEVNNAKPPYLWRGPIWRFSIPPPAAYNPIPPDGFMYVAPKMILRWTAGMGAASHDVYFGINFADVNNGTGGTFRGNQAGITYDPPGDLNYNKTYYWRIDEKGTTTTKGAVWDFKTVPTAPTEPNLVGWWKFDGDVTDSGYGCDGTVIGSPGYVTGLFGNPAIDINNINDANSANDIYVDVPIGSVISSLTNSTFAVWVNWRGTEGDRRNQRFFSFGTSPADYMFLSPRRSSSAPTHFEISTGGTMQRVSWGPYSSDGTTIPANEWHHLAVTFNASTNTLTLYIDGVVPAGGQITPTTLITPSSLGYTTQNWFGRCENPAQQRPYRGYLDDLRIYDRALSAAEIADIAAPQKAWLPSPANGAKGAKMNSTLTWRAGYYADKHDVYLGTGFNDVNNANRSNDPCNVLVSQNQDPCTYDPGLLDANTTYYWRIDEVNLAKDPNIIKGDVWSFTTRQEFIITTAIGNGADTYLSNDGQSGNYGPNSIHGMDGGIEIRNYANTRLKIAYLRFDISDITEDMTGTKLSLNVTSSTRGRTLGVYGLKDSAGLDNWNEATTSYNTAPGFIPNPPTPLNSYAIDANILTRLAGLPVETTPGWYNSEPNALMNAFFNADTDNLLTFAVLYESSDTTADWWVASKEGDPNLAPRLVMPSPKATEPYPANGAVDVPSDVVLSWKPGRYADKHDVYLGTDSAAVTNADRGNDPCNVLVSQDQDPNYYNVTGLLPSTTYYWRIDEVNMAETPNIWRGDIWSFKTGLYLVVEDFDSYANDTALHAVWMDYTTTPPGINAYTYVNTDVNRHGNSMQYDYKDYADPYYSEAYAATTALPSGIGKDWTIGDVEALVLYFYGQAGNDANEKMYVKLTDGTHTKSVIYDGDAEDVTEPVWHEWNIKLTAFTGVTLTNVTRITIGFGDGSDPYPATGTGTVYFEDIRLYQRRCILTRRSDDFARADYIPDGGDCDVNYQELQTMVSNWLGATEQIRLEAENANTIKAPMQVYSDRADASGGKYIEVLPGYPAPYPPTNPDPLNDPNCGVATYNFTVNGGTYKVFGRVVAPADNQDSFWCRIPGATTNTNNDPNDPNWIRWDVSEAAGNDWAWDELNSDNDNDTTVEFTLSAGQHTLQIVHRERTKLDRLLITDDLGLDVATLLAWDADLNGDNKIDLKDFALLAKQWLIEELWP